jgi:hypothetical protein
MTTTIMVIAYMMVPLRAPLDSHDEGGSCTPNWLWSCLELVAVLGLAGVAKHEQL